MDKNIPFIVDETDDFAVVFKPPKMHSAPLKKKDGGTLLEWYASRSSPVFDIMHRLDFETHGLVLFAKNVKSFDFFKILQENSRFIKEYSAVCKNDICKSEVYKYTGCGDSAMPCFPQPPNLNIEDHKPSTKEPLVIESYFRPFGAGRKFVRPVTEIKKHYEIAKDRGNFYRTEIIGINENVFTVQIKRGFRHQIRCHLYWIGFPVLNDPLYQYTSQSQPLQQLPVNNELALRSHALFFYDPSTEKQKEYRIDPLES
jgi:23S rRNA pseudouridine1911/1915/1917 synthase